MRKPTAPAPLRAPGPARAACTLQAFAAPGDHAQRLVLALGSELPFTFREQARDDGARVIAIDLEGAACTAEPPELGPFALRRDDAGSVVRVEVAADHSATLVRLGAAPRFVLDLVAEGGRDPKLVVLDPGHGGADRGVPGAGGLDEAALAFDVAQRAARWLTQYDPSLRATLTRSADEGAAPFARTARANALGAAAFVSIHVALDGAPGGVATYVLDPVADPGSEALVERENLGEPSGALSVPLGAAIVGARVEAARRLAEHVHNRVYRGARNVAPGLTNRGIHRGPLAVLVGAAMPAVVVELGALADAGDAQRLADARVRDAMAEGIARGLVRYLAGL